MFAQPLIWFVWKSQWHDPTPESRFTFVVLIHCLAVQSSYEQSGNLLNGSMWTKWPVKFAVWTKLLILIKRFSYDLEMKTREQNRNNKRTEIEWFDWFIERIQTRVVFGWLGERSAEKLHARRAFSKSIDTSLWRHTATHYWPIEQCLLHIRVVCGGNTKSPCFDLFIHWLMKQITNTYRNHFSRSYENRSIWLLDRKVICTFEKRSPDWTYVMSFPKITIIFVTQPFIRIFFLISGLRPSFSIVKRPSN